MPAALLAVAAGAVWLFTRPPAPDDLARRALAAYPERDGVVHQVVDTSGWTDRVHGFGYGIESWERRPDGLRRVRWIDHGLARADASVVDGELLADRRGPRRLWYRSRDGTFAGDWPLEDRTIDARRSRSRPRRWTSSGSCGWRCAPG